MKELTCNKCTQCCQWEFNKDLAAEVEADEYHYLIFKHVDGGYRLDFNKTGGCIYLINNQCSIYDQRPKICRRFDCRELYNSMPDSIKNVRQNVLTSLSHYPLTRILIEAEKRL